MITYFLGNEKTDEMMNIAKQSDKRYWSGLREKGFLLRTQILPAIPDKKILLKKISPRRIRGLEVSSEDYHRNSLYIIADPGNLSINRLDIYSV